MSKNFLNFIVGLSILLMLVITWKGYRKLFALHLNSWVFGEGGRQRSTEVAFTLLDPASLVKLLALPKKFSGIIIVPIYVHSSALLRVRDGRAKTLA